MEKKTKNYLDRVTIQQEELNILAAFTDFCDKYDLYYSLDCGTLLGAVRHKGFIPWDDDIDLSMPRTDYETLLTMSDQFEKETGCKIIYFGRDERYAPFVKVINPKIKVSYSDAEKRSQSYLWIDIFPFDGIEADETSIRSVFSKAAYLKKYFWISESRWMLGETVFRKLVRGCISPLVLLSGFDKYCGRKLYELSKSVKYEDATHVTCIAWGFDHMNKALEKNKYETAVELEFCGRAYKAMSCWDEYLIAAYGDYMQLPPEEDRVAHDIRAWRAE